MGRSRGGFGTPLPLAVDGLGNPVEFILTGGPAADVTEAEALIDGHEAEAVIPPKKNRKCKRNYDKHLYKERNLAERFINRIKQYRRVATRYEKTARNFLGFVHVAAIMVLLL